MPVHTGKLNPIESVDDILELYERRGSSQYGGEAVTQWEHAAQSAGCAISEDADASLVAAAFLHDVGHLLHDLPENAPASGLDDHHENSAARALASLFGPEVCEPVRLHVAAKRFLTAVEPAYMKSLSGPSVTSLMLQGGPMSDEEQAEFRRNPHWEAAVRLRRWDEQAKIPGAAAPDAATLRPYLEKAASRGSR